MWFRDSSVRTKLMILMMLASSLALLLMCIVLLAYDVSTAKQATAAHVSSLAKIIADNSQAAVSFGDPKAAHEVLSTLRAEPHIAAAYIFDKQGNPFAEYHAQGLSISSVPVLRSPGAYFEAGGLSEYRQMTVGGEDIGSVCIVCDLADVNERYQRYAGILAAVMLLSWLVALLIGSRLQRTITEPLDDLIAVARAIGESGDLNHEIDVERKDEIGNLANSFRNMIAYLKEMADISQGMSSGDLSREITPRSERDTLGYAFASMTEGLRDLVRNVREDASQLAKGSNKVAASSGDSAKVSERASSAIDEVTSTMHEMSANAQNVAKSTQMQTGSVSETSSSMDEMAASIQRVADTCQVLLEISDRSRQEVQSGINSMEQAADGLNRINNSIQLSSEMMRVLGERADSIGKIVEVIDDLADQSNLLALNAAIEAARAGEHGLGFAVVADEVRKLAEKSAQSTQEIADLIRGVQQESRRAVDNMKKSASIVSESLALGSTLSAALKKISAVVSEVYRFAEEISAATNEQSNGSSQIIRATIRLTEITREIDSSVGEQASGALATVKAMEKMRELVQQSSASSADLAASAEQMSGMARDMMTAVGRFKLEDVPKLSD
jgi:methyl-accepting chemotaxis protein